jgi:IS5 family transposase
VDALLLYLDGIEKLLEILILFAFKQGFIKPDKLSQVVVDTTVQEKYVTYPTGSKLYHKARIKLVDLATALGIDLRQTYVRVGKRAYLMSGRYGHARQYKRMKREIRKLKCYLRRVVCDIERKLLKANIHNPHLIELLGKANQLLQQSKQSKNKLYSLHAPEVECIAKGKIHKKYEFGVKVGIVTTLKNSWVLASEAMHGNPYDGHTLKYCIEKAKKICNKPLKQVFVDRGYKGHGITDTNIYLAGQKRGITPTLKRKLKRRSAIEPVIGHLKSDHRMGTNYLLGKSGDKINAICSAIGFNLKKILGMIAVA